MAWYNWVAIAIFAVSSTICYLLEVYEDDASPMVRAWREISRLIAGTCVVMFIFQGLDMLQS